MNKRLTQILSVGIALLVLVGCGNGGGNGKGGVFTKKTTPDSYPIKTDAKLTYWCDLSGHVSAHSKSLNETPFAKNLIEKTGINVEFIHPAAGGAGQTKEQFNLMIASGDLPDIIESAWLDYPGGPDKAINENIIISLNKVFSEVSPNLMKFYDAHPDYKKQMQTVAGNFYHYPFIRGDEKLMTYTGVMVRKDLLDKVGMSAPETISEWDKVLRAFKANGVKTPLTIKIDNTVLANVSPFLGAYGLAGTFFVENDKVKFGPYEPKFNDYMKQLASWYSDGILDSNFMDIDAKRITALVANGDVGAAFGTAGGDFGKWIPALKATMPSAEFVPIKYPTSAKGVRPMYGQKDLPVSTVGAAISGQCKNVELAARLLDYGFSEEGQLFYNFGRENESYVVKNGVPSYTEIVTEKSKNGDLAIGAAIGKYARASYNGPFIQNVNYLTQFYSLDAQKKALDVWPDTDTLKYKLPISLLTEEENKEYSAIMQDVDLYRQSAFYKIVTGKETNTDAYFRELKDRKIERAIAIQQAAYDRYKAR